MGYTIMPTQEISTSILLRSIFVETIYQYLVSSDNLEHTTLAVRVEIGGCVSGSKLKNLSRLGEINGKIIETLALLQY